MGQVFAAVHENMGQEVALKLLLPDPEGDPQRVARFLQEARALAELNHPGVVRVYHCDRTGDTAFLAMELLHGQSLREWMHGQTGPVSLSSALILCRQIASVMADVHARNIVHRDLKPENVFLCPETAAPLGYRVKLLDFGIAKLPPIADGVLAATQVHTHASTLLGTYTYMAPEQLNPSSVDGRADVYSLGVLLFELLTGHAPFVADDPVKLLTAHQHETPPSLKQWVPTLPAAFCAFVDTMLAKTPGARPTMPRCREVLAISWEHVKEGCPVPGLAPFTEEAAELFFGRKEETRALLELLGEARVGRRRWVQVEGLSGVGKSSLLRAGVLPRLQESQEPGEARWIIATMRSMEAPARNLARALTDAYANAGAEKMSEEQVERALTASPEALRDFVTSHTPQGSLLLLVIDPMEELFTLDADVRDWLDARLAAALAAPECPLRLLTSLRSDFLHRLKQLPGLAHQFHGAARYPVLPMEEEALAQVIQGLARHAGLPLGRGLAERMVRDTQGEGGRLPLLGHALRELWTLSAGKPLTLEHYERIGGVGGALARQAEGLLESLGAEGKERARCLLLELVQVGRGVPDTRRPRSREQVLSAAGGDELAEQVLLRLTGMRTGNDSEAQQGLRLVLLSAEAEPSRQRVELVHETLLHKVPSLAEWIEQDRPLLERQADLEAIALVWEQRQCPTEGLPTGTLLQHYRGAMDAPQGGGSLARKLSSREARFLQAAERLERQRAWAQRARMATAAIAAGLLIVFFTGRIEQERLAMQALHRSLDVLESFVGGLDWEFSRAPYTLEARRRMLQIFEKTLNSLSEHERQDPKAQLTRIRLRHRQSDLAFHDDTLAEADGFLRAAREQLDAGLTLHSEDGEWQKELALNHSKRGKVALARGDTHGASAHFTQALKLLDHPGVKTKDSVDDRRTKAVSHSEWAELQFQLGHTDDAAQAYESAIRLHQENQNGKEDHYNRYLLAEALSNRGEVVLSAGKGDDKLDVAERYLEQAFDLGQDCVKAKPGNQVYRLSLALTLVRLGRLRDAQKRTELADQHFKEAETHGRSLREGEPLNKRYAIALAKALQSHEESLQARGAHEQAERLRSERCKLVKPFRKEDDADVRFNPLSHSCPPEGK